MLYTRTGGDWMGSRGVNRSLYSALFDDPDFQALPAAARHTLLTARLCPQAGPGAIFICYPEILARQTGLSLRCIEGALKALEGAGWIQREGLILWVVNGLRYDPTMHLSDAKHQKAVARAVAALPHLSIVLRFCEYYGITRPFDGPSETKTTLALPKTENREPRTENREPRTENREPRKPSAGASPAAGAGIEAWNGYRDAYQRRYGVEPVRNAKVNSQLALFVKRIPAVEVAEVAAWYLGNNAALYVRAGHPVDLLLRDAEKLRTEWATGQRVTETGARASDQRQERGGIADRLLAKAARQRGSGDESR